MFQAEESGEYSVRKNLTAERGAPAEYLVSYAFFSEVAFCYGEDEVNPQFLIATEENRRLLKGEDVVDFSLYQEAEEGIPQGAVSVDETPDAVPETVGNPGAELEVGSQEQPVAEQAQPVVEQPKEAEPAFVHPVEQPQQPSFKSKRRKRKKY